MKYRKSQIAVIITFVIAVIFLFIAVFINLSKVSQVKTTTGTAADKAALGLASQLGSISHYYKDTVLKGKTLEDGTPGECEADWTSLTALILTGIAGIAMFFPPVGTAISIGAAAISMAMLSGINARYSQMTGYNALRESALFQALAYTQSDDVELKRTGVGIFHDETTGQDYDLRMMPEMHNERKVNRFSAWYYTKRLIFAGDDYLKQAVDTFKSALNGFINIDERDSAKWKINKLSYLIEPGPASKGADYEITCTSGTCPPWVKNIALKQIAVIKIDATKPKGAEQITGGFPREKFLDLAKRLKNSYGLSFCAKGSLDSVYCDDIDFLMLDLWDFLLKIKEVSDLPASYAYKNVTQWLPSFYNSDKHNKDKDRTAKDCDSLDCDVYSRLTRDQNKINSWIKELENLDNTRIIPDIKNKHGECPWGRGSIVKSSCNTIYGQDCSICGGGYCGESESTCNSSCMPRCCYNPAKCAWEGIYYTCCQNPPVCSNGDIPDWCASHGAHDQPCSRSCPGCNVQNFNCADDAKSFQGRLAHDNTSGPTEVEQALKILRALNYNITQIKGVISDLADKVDFYFNINNKGEFFTDANNNGVYDEGEDFKDLNGNWVYDSVFPEAIKRDEIVYAWKDKQGFSHLAAVKINGYPKKLPNVTESAEWGWSGPIPYPQRCRRLNDYEGDFTITTWRYDQDQPTEIGKTAEGGWKLRRRRQGPFSTGKEFSPEVLDHIVTDIQDDGKISTSDEGPIKQLLYWYAITSISQVHYGPEKSDIKITKTEGD